MYAVVPDTNVIVSGSIVPYGNPAFILNSWRNGQIQIITSMEVLDEFEDVMIKQFNMPLNDVRMLKGFFIWKGTVVEPKIKLKVIKEDPSDNKFLEIALEGKADYIVSGDKHLKKLSEFKGVKIVSPAEMAEIIRKKIYQGQ